MRSRSRAPVRPLARRAAWSLELSEAASPARLESRSTSLGDNKAWQSGKSPSEPCLLRLNPATAEAGRWDEGWGWAGQTPLPEMLPAAAGVSRIPSLPSRPLLRRQHCSQAVPAHPQPPASQRNSRLTAATREAARSSQHACARAVSGAQLLDPPKTALQSCLSWGLGRKCPILRLPQSIFSSTAGLRASTTEQKGCSLSPGWSPEEVPTYYEITGAIHPAQHHAHLSLLLSHPTASLWRSMPVAPQWRGSLTLPSPASARSWSSALLQPQRLGSESQTWDSWQAGLGSGRGDPKRDRAAKGCRGAGSTGLRYGDLFSPFLKLETPWKGQSWLFWEQPSIFRSSHQQRLNWCGPEPPATKPRCQHRITE